VSGQGTLNTLRGSIIKATATVPVSNTWQSAHMRVSIGTGNEVQLVQDLDGGVHAREGLTCAHTVHVFHSKVVFKNSL